MMMQPRAVIDAELSRTEADLGRSSNITFTVYARPDFEVNWHHEVVARKLDDVLVGRCKRLIVLEPPQNGKTEQISRCFPAYALGRNPDLRVIALSYGDSLAQDISRDVQRIIDSKAYQDLFPGTRLAKSSDPEKRTQGQFDVVGHRGYYVAAGIMGSIVGKSLDIGIIDDPIKNRAEAESEAYRNRVWEQYRSAFATRQFGSDCAIVIGVTRWHEDDLVGRLLKLAEDDPKADQWEVLSFEAVAESRSPYDQRQPGKPLWPSPYDQRQPGKPLWPSKYPLQELQKRRANLGAYDWAALYQQRPAPEGGGLFKREWFQISDVMPVGARRLRGWDTAASEGKGDYTVGVRMAECDGIFYVDDVVRGQWGPRDVERIIRQTAEMDGCRCMQREEKEGGSAGLAVIQSRLRLLAGCDYAGVSVTGSKVTRARPYRAQCEGGNVHLIRDAWNEPYIQELCSFPSAKHDDQVDASSCAFNALVREARTVGDYGVTV